MSVNEDAKPLGTYFISQLPDEMLLRILEDAFDSPGNKTTSPTEVIKKGNFIVANLRGLSHNFNRILLSIEFKSSTLTSCLLENNTLVIKSEQDLEGMNALHRNGLLPEGLRLKLANKKCFDSFISSGYLNDKVTHLDLYDNCLGVTAAELLVQALSRMSNLIELNLNNNFIGPGMELLTEALSGMVNLKILKLQNNYIGTGGLQALSGALSGVVSIEVLNFNYNSIAEDGLQHLVGLLNNMTELTELHLRGNTLGAEMFAQHLIMMNNISILDLSRSRSRGICSNIR